MRGGYNRGGYGGGGGGNTICGSLCTSVFGLGLLLCSFGLLFWNEGNAVMVAQGLDEGLSLVVEIDAADVNPVLEGRLVHLTALATGATVRDPLFGIEVDNAVRVNRRVEMFQWHEIKHSRKVREHDPYTGTNQMVRHTDYEYRPQWSSSAQGMQRFHHPERCQPPNPRQLPFPSTAHEAPRVVLGGYEAGPAAVASMAWEETVDVRQKAVQIDNKALAVSSLVPAASGRELRTRNTPPEVGDVRVTFTVTKADTTSVVARVQQGRLVPFQTSGGQEILLVQRGAHSGLQMFKTAHDQNNLLCWALRAAGWLLAFISLLMVLAPISALASSVPIFGGLLSSIAGAGSCCAAFSVSLSLSLLVASCAWLWYRPLLSVALLAAAVASMYLAKTNGARQSHASAAPQGRAWRRAD